MPPRSRKQAKSRAQKVAEPSGAKKAAEPISTSKAGSAEQAKNAAQQTFDVEQETVGQGYVIPISPIPFLSSSLSPCSPSVPQGPTADKSVAPRQAKAKTKSVTLLLPVGCKNSDILSAIQNDICEASGAGYCC